MHRATGSLSPFARLFRISTATATTTVFIHTLKQGRVALRSSSLVLASGRRKSRNGIQRKEIRPDERVELDAGSGRAKNNHSNSRQSFGRGFWQSRDADRHRSRAFHPYLDRKSTRL